MHLEQYIPSYKEDYNKFPWVVYESAHYIFHVGKNSLAEKEIFSIIARQEDAFRKVVSKLVLEAPGKKIKYYFYDSAQEKERLMGSAWYAQVIYKDFAIHALYNSDHKVVGEHEDTHLLTLPWGLSIGFLQEGLAEYLVGHDWHGQDFKIKVREAREKDMLPPLQAMMDHEAWLLSPDDKAAYYYCYAGSFVTFLIEKYGLQKFKQCYLQTSRAKGRQENIDVFKNVYMCSFESIEKDYGRFVH